MLSNGDDRRRTLSPKDEAEVIMKYIGEVKKEFAQRAAAVKEEIGQEINLDYPICDVKDPKQQRVHQKFISGKMSKLEVSEYEKGFLTELDNLLKIIVEAEKKSSISWEKRNKGKNQKKDDTQMTTEELYGEKISAKKLGVILDNSGSMAKYLPQLREEIKKKFPNSYFIEIYGATISHYDFTSREGDAHWHFVTPEEGDNPFLPFWNRSEMPKANLSDYYFGLMQDNISAFKALALIRKVDAIYWFTDLKDEVTDSGSRTFEAILRASKVKLYIHTIGRRPSRKLSDAIKKYGIKVINKKMK